MSGAAAEGSVSEGEPEAEPPPQPEVEPPTDPPLPPVSTTAAAVAASRIAVEQAQATAELAALAVDIEAARRRYMAAVPVLLFFPELKSQKHTKTSAQGQGWGQQNWYLTPM